MFANPIYKFIGAFLGIILVVLGGWWVWDGYLSPEAREAREFTANYERKIKEAEDILRADTYGGKTPQETLDLFIAALRAGDVELASKYFAIDTNSGAGNTINENYLKRDPKWFEALKVAKENEEFNEIVNIISRAKPSTRNESDDTQWYEVKGEDGVVDYSIVLKLNIYSNVWKIESL